MLGASVGHPWGILGASLVNPVVSGDIRGETVLNPGRESISVVKPWYIRSKSVVHPCISVVHPGISVVHPGTSVWHPGSPFFPDTLRMCHGCATDAPRMSKDAPRMRQGFTTVLIPSPLAPGYPRMLHVAPAARLPSRIRHGYPRIPPDALRFSNSLPGLTTD